MAQVFFVSSSKPHSCEIVTVQHVEDDDIAQVMASDRKIRVARAELIDSVHQLSFYKLEGVENPEEICRELPMSNAEPHARQPIVVISVTAGDEWRTPTFRTGKLEGTTTASVLTEWLPRWLTSWLSLPKSAYSPEITTTARITAPGYSGGPWLDRTGAVIGINNEGSLFHSFAIPARSIQEDLDLINRANMGGGMHMPIRIDDK